MKTFSLQVQGWRTRLQIAAMSMLVGMYAAIAAAPASAVTISRTPLTVSLNVPGNLVLVPSVEFPTVISQANGGDFVWNQVYTGYFDSGKCYSYKNDSDPGNDDLNIDGDDYFEPISSATNMTCGGTAWSGNFLNWALTQTIDPFRMALTGGYRVVDTADATVLEKATFPLEHRGKTSNFPRKTLTDAAVIKAVTPVKWSQLYMRVDGLKNKFWITGYSDQISSDNLDSTNRLVPTGTYNGFRTPLFDYTSSRHNLGTSEVTDTDIVGRWRRESANVRTVADQREAVFQLTARVKVCVAAVGVESNCKQYGSNWKPEGLIQSYSDRLRYSVFSYLNVDDTRDGGVMRARMKFVGANTYDPVAGILSNANKEWDPATGVFYRNPDPADATAGGQAVSDSGVINYINKFGQLGNNSLKTYDNVSELWYAAQRYLRNKSNIATYSQISNMSQADWFPVITEWDDPMKYRCQANAMIGIGDTNTHVDKNLPGNTNATREPTKPAEVHADTYHATANPNGIDVDAAMQRIAAMQGSTYNAAPASFSSGAGQNNSGYVAALAYWAHTHDIRPDLAGKQSITTYFVDVLEYQDLKPPATNQYYLAAKYGGFSVPEGFDPDTAAATLPNATWNTGGQKIKTGNQSSSNTWVLKPDNYFPANDPNSMIAGLQQAFAGSASGQGSGGSLAANSTSLDTGVMVYQAKFNTKDWSGDMMGFAVDPMTGAQAATASWVASHVLPAWASRPIKVWNGSQLKTFEWANLTASQQAALVSQDVVNWLRGDVSKAIPAGDLRVRTEGLIGDIVNSQPVYVGSPVTTLYQSGPTFAGKSAYGAFVAARGGRTPIIYVGSNGGMLHGFNATSGVENFAFVPNFAINGGMANIAHANYVHHYSVDGELTVADVYIGGAWKTVLVGVAGRGGRAVYALDVTDPANVQFLWEKNETDIAGLGNVLGKPIIAQTSNGIWKALIGNGPNSTGGNAQLVSIDIATGTASAIDTGVGGDNGLTSIQAWDSDRDGFTDRAYAGDLKGNLWRFDLAGNTVSRLFTARDSLGNAQPITAAPLVGQKPSTNEIWVFFGTGRFLAGSDTADKSVQTWYGLQDDGTAIAGRSSLKEREITGEFALTVNGDARTARTISIGTQAELAAKRGWYIDLVSPVAGEEGERMVVPNLFHGYALVGNSRTPGSDPCSPGGKGFLMTIDPFSGAALESNFFDVNGDGRVDSSDSVTVNGQSVAVSGIGFGSGLNNPTFTGDVAQLSLDDASRRSVGTGGSLMRQRRVAWREIINR